MSSNAPRGPILRRAHRKSRLGCKACKLRHIKCDEKRPVCENCSSTQRECVFPFSAAPRAFSSAPASATPILRREEPTPLVLSPQPTPVGTPSSISSSSIPTVPVSLSSGASPVPPLPHFPHPHPHSHPPPSHGLQTESFGLSGDYNLCHLELIDYFTSVVVKTPGHAEQVTTLVPLAMSYVFKNAFLMDETLAVAAAYKSTTLPPDSESREFYEREAAALQLRALSRFNQVQAQADISVQVPDEHHHAVFTFSCFLGLHGLIDTFAAQTEDTNLSTVLDRLAHCLGLHRGIRAIAVLSLDSISEKVHSHLGPNPEVAAAMTSKPPPPLTPGDECSPLLTMLENESDLSPADRATYRTVVDILQSSFDAQKPGEGTPLLYRQLRLVRAVHEFSVRVSQDYVKLMEKRRPEALVILAYYGVLLHRTRFYFAVKDAGRFLVRKISSHLGTFWARYLAWPKEEVEQGGFFGDPETVLA